MSSKKQTDFEESNGAVCVQCGRIYTLQELDEIGDSPLAPCGHSWGYVFDCVIEKNIPTKEE